MPKWVCWRITGFASRKWIKFRTMEMCSWKPKSMISANSFTRKKSNKRKKLSISTNWLKLIFIVDKLTMPETMPSNPYSNIKRTSKIMPKWMEKGAQRFSKFTKKIWKSFLKIKTLSMPKKPLISKFNWSNKKRTGSWRLKSSWNEVKLILSKETSFKVKRTWKKVKE